MSLLIEEVEQDSGVTEGPHDITKFHNTNPGKIKYYAGMHVDGQYVRW